MGTKQGFWHWPRFDEVVGSHMCDRALLGVGESIFTTRPQYTANALHRLSGAKKSDWLALLGDNEASLELRCTAGLFLAISGDPRIKTLNPEMCEVHGGNVHIGLAPTDVSRVFHELTGLGIDRDWIRKETPRHEVDLAPYRIGKYPVTNQEFRDYLLKTGGTSIPTSWRFGRFPVEKANHPVHTISAQVASLYCKWLSCQTRRLFRLPSEAEWEFAAAGPEGCDYPWGNTFEPGHANTAEEGLFASTSVGTFPRGQSWCGAHDMAGNVEEFVNDTYSPYPGAALIEDDLSKTLKSFHVARGGSYTRFRDLARTRRRHGHYPRDVYVMGFRIAESCD